MAYRCQQFCFEQLHLAQRLLVGSRWRSSFLNAFMLPMPSIVSVMLPPHAPIPWARGWSCLVLDQAGWHSSKELVVPEGIHLLFLPPHSPELQPCERLCPLSNE